MHSAEVPSFKKKWITVLSKELNLCTITNADFLYTKGENSPLSLQIWNGISEQKFGSHGDGHGAEPNRVWAQSALVDDPKIHHPWAYSSANKVKPSLTIANSRVQFLEYNWWNVFWHLQNRIIACLCTGWIHLCPDRYQQLVQKR